MSLEVSRIEDKATKILKENNAYSLPVDVESLLDSLDIELEVRELENEFSGFLVSRGSKYAIVVNRQHAKVRQRFTVAHEIGHYLLHAKRKGKESVFIDRFHFRRSNPQPQGLNYKEEREANTFAAGLLMPSELVRKYMDEGEVTSIKGIAEEFNVSPQAMEYRLKDLGFIQIG